MNKRRAAPGQAGNPQPARHPDCQASSQRGKAAARRAASALACFDSASLRVSRVAHGALIFALALTLWPNMSDFFSTPSPASYLAGALPAKDYLEGRMGWYSPAISRLGALPPGSRVVFLWESRSFDCPAAITCDARQISASVGESP